MTISAKGFNLVPVSEILDRVGISSATINQWQNRHDFPGAIIEGLGRGKGQIGKYPAFFEDVLISVLELKSEGHKVGEAIKIAFSKHVESRLEHIGDMVCGVMDFLDCASAYGRLLNARDDLSSCMEVIPDNLSEIQNKLVAIQGFQNDFLKSYCSWIGEELPDNLQEDQRIPSLRVAMKAVTNEIPWKATSQLVAALRDQIGPVLKMMSDSGIDSDIKSTCDELHKLILIVDGVCKSLKFRK